MRMMAKVSGLPQMSRRGKGIKDVTGRIKILCLEHLPRCIHFFSSSDGGKKDFLIFLVR